MAIKCPACHSENPDTQSFCGGCGTQLPAPQGHPPVMTETLQAPVQELTTGSTFASRYQVIEELGHGGMGRVYKVFDTKIKEKVALKLIKPEIASDKDTIERFGNELRLARKISQRNVCRMFDMGEAEGSHFITMEYVHGEDLKSMIRMSGSLSLGMLLSVGKQVCDGLAEAHALGVVHRDLKPQNIMIDKNGSAKIMDFGIARSVREKGITGPSVMIGTPEYMSPEQAEARDVDPRSDIYSLGVILYEMATSHVPFEGETALSIAMKHKGEIPKNPKQLNPHIPDDLGAVILKCLEKDKSRRYQSASEVHSELEKIEKGIPTTERVVPERKAITSREITVKFRLYRLLVPLAVVSVVAIVAGFLFLKPKGLKFDANRVAVAVFDNQTGDPKLDSLGREAAQWITEGLTTANLFAVAPLPSAESLQSRSGIKDPLKKLAAETGAGKIVSGSYHLRGDTIRFYADIRDMNTGKILDALPPADGPRLEPNRPLEHLRAKLMGAVACLFDPFMRPWLTSMKEPPNFESFRDMLEGMRLFLRHDYAKAIEHLNQAVVLDPSNNMARICIVTSLHNSGKLVESQSLADEIQKSRGELSGGEGLMLDYMQAWLHGDLAERHRLAKRILPDEPFWENDRALDAANDNYPQEAVEAFKKMRLEDEWYKTWGGQWWVITSAYHMLGEYKQELREARRARKERPESLWYLRFEVRAVSAMGRMKDIDRLIDESASLPSEGGWGPLDIMTGSAEELRAHGFVKESYQLLDRAQKWLESRPPQNRDSVEGRDYSARILMYLDRWKEAQEKYEALLKGSPSDIDYICNCGTLAARLGEREKALGYSKQLEEIKTPFLFGVPTYLRALIAACLGDKEDAVNLLRVAISQGYAYPGIHGSAALEPLKDYPPYIQLMKPK